MTSAYPCLDRGDDGIAQPALGQLLVELLHEIQETVQAGLVEEEQRLVGRHPLDVRQAESAVQGEQSAVCHPEHVACAGLLQGGEVIILGAEAIVGTDGPTQTTTAAIRNVDGKCSRQSTTESHQVLGGVDAAVQQDNAGPATQLPVADPSAVGWPRKPSCTGRVVSWSSHSCPS